jgi:hypothetical protein
VESIVKGANSISMELSRRQSRLGGRKGHSRKVSSIESIDLSLMTALMSFLANEFNKVARKLKGYIKAPMQRRQEEF